MGVTDRGSEDILRTVRGGGGGQRGGSASVDLAGQQSHAREKKRESPSAPDPGEAA